jgi:hypothetical protein
MKVAGIFGGHLTLAVWLVCCGVPLYFVIVLDVEARAMVESCIALSIGAGPSSRYFPAEVALHAFGFSHFNLAHPKPPKKISRITRQHDKYSRIKGSDIDRARLW